MMSESTDSPENPEEKSAKSATKKPKTTKSIEESPITHEDTPEALSAITDETALDDFSVEEEEREGGVSDDTAPFGDAPDEDDPYETVAPEPDIEGPDLDADSDENPRDIFDTETDEELLNRVAGVYHIWWNWAHFELSIISPYIDTIEPPVIIQPENIGSGDETEFVYPIIDYGNRLATSKATNMYSAGMSMCRLYYTIEKMIHILIERLKSCGIDTETEVQIAFDGHQFAQRKAFESVINLSYNVVVNNFDPGAWGERYLEVVKHLAEKGYGYPAEAPRETYRQFSRASVGVKR